ncbi:tetratricopeptide repeat protein [Stutzerimonas stutzeri]|nr:tetratricopeptide repeat protein [Stutzerimonas stutzeri]
MMPHRNFSGVKNISKMIDFRLKRQFSVSEGLSKALRSNHTRPLPTGHTKPNSRWQTLAIALLVTITGITSDPASATNTECQSLLRKRDLASAQSICNQELVAQQAAARNGKKTELEALARAHDNLGSLYMLRREHREAEAQYRASLAARQKAFGRNHHLQAISMLPLAEALTLQSKTAEAESLLLKALALRQSSLGSHSEAAAQTHHALGVFYTRTNASKAESSFRKEITILERLYPSGSPATAIAYNNLGILRQRAGQTDQAESYYRSAVRMLERTTPNDKRKLTGPLLNLATVLTEKKQYTAAKPLLLQLLNIRKQLQGPNAVGVADIHNRLGILHSRTGAMELAEAELRKALTVRENSLGSNHLLVAESCTNLGIFLMHRNRLKEALPLLRHAAAVTHSQTGPQSTQTATAWTNLEQLYGRLIQEATARN